MALARIRDYFGPYRLTRLIRAGNSREIWEAAKDGDSTPVALKIIKREMCRNASEIAALKREVDVGRKLSHRNVLRIDAYAVEGDTPYSVMELFSATSLKQDLHIPPGLIPKIIWQAADALYHVHDQGFVHGATASNHFLVNKAGEIKLIDFANARPAKQSLWARLGFRSWFAKKIPGNPEYLAPEQILGRAWDARTDLYSFGCTLFELVGGRTPYAGTSTDDLLQNHVRAPIPELRRLNANVTPEFSDLVRRMTAKLPADRPQSVFKFLEEFRNVRVFRHQAFLYPRRFGGL